MPGSFQQSPLVLFLAYPRMGLLDLTGPQTVFWAAAKRTLQRNLPTYERHTVSAHGGLIETIEGVVIDTLPFSAFDGRAIDTIVVPGAPEIATLLGQLGTTVEWVRQAAVRARRTTSVCTGAFLLA